MGDEAVDSLNRLEELYFRKASYAVTRKFYGDDSDFADTWRRPTFFDVLIFWIWLSIGLYTLCLICVGGFIFATYGVMTLLHNIFFPYDWSITLEKALMFEFIPDLCRFFLPDQTCAKYLGMTALRASVLFILYAGLLFPIVKVLRWTLDKRKAREMEIYCCIENIRHGMKTEKPSSDSN